MGTIFQEHPQPMSKTSELKVRVEPELLQRFREAAKAEDKKVSAVIRELMEFYIRHCDRTVQADLFDQKLEDAPYERN